MPRQKTFTLVPNPVGIQGLIDRAGHGVESKPPMTSKQAKKLYQQANRGPRLSKAEQRCLEREEQERIRRDFEKEKQANKARILREKKKAKEQQVIDEKKKRRLPLVTVRPSQDTIARFVRGNGAGKKRDSAGATVELPAVAEEAKAEAEAEDEQADFEIKDSDRDRKLPAYEEDNTRSRKKPRIETDDVRVETGRTPAKEVGSLVESTSAVGAKEAGRRLDSLFAEVTLTAAAGDRDKETVKPAKTTRGNLPPASLATVLEPIICEKLPGDKDKENIRPGEKTSSSALSPRRFKGPGGVQVEPSKTLDQALPKELPTALPVPKAQQSIPAQKVPRLPTTQHQIHILQQGPSTRPLPVQTPTARQPLQKNADSVDRSRPSPAVNTAAKFATPHRPGQTTASRPIRASPAIPVFKQSTRPETPTGRAQKPGFLSPHVRNTTAPHQPTPKPAPAPKKLESAKKADYDFMTAPLTSTQLFVIRNIDDFPTLSQEELEEARSMASPKAQKVDAFRPPFAGFAKPAPRLNGHGTQAKASMPPPPRQPTRQGAPIKAPMAPPPVPRQLTRQTAHVKPPMAPPPRPVSARPATKALEPSTLPFFSTQDLLISSQDLRDLDETTTTPSKPSGGMRPPPFKKPPSVQRQPSPLVRILPAVNPGMAQAQPPKQAPAKPALVKQSPGPVRGPTPPRPLTPRPQAHHKRKDPIKPSNVPNEKQVSQPKRYTPPRDAANPSKQSENPFEPAPRPPSPEKPRFFGPSGSGVQLLLALTESRKTHEAEEKKRRAEQARQGTTNSRSLEQEPRKASQQGKPKIAAGRGPCSLPRPLQQSPQQENNKIPCQRENAGNQKIPPVIASQETDYGDFDIDAIDFLDL